MAGRGKWNVHGRHDAGRVVAVLYPWLAPASVRRCFCDRQPKSGAFDVRRRRPEKTIIDVRQRCAGNAATGIDDFYLERVFRPLAVDVYLSPGAGVSDRVIDQIGKNE